MKKQTITLTIGETEFKFEHTASDYNDYINGLMPDNKIAPAHNLLVRTVNKDQKDDLKKVLANSPGAEIQIAALLNQEFAPALEISVKK